MYYYGRNPVRTAGEMVSCLRENNEELTAQVRSNGAYVVYIAGKIDILVPETEHIAGMVDKYVLLDAGHLAPQHRSSLVAKHIIAAQQELRAAKEAA
jgi:hypothetical protein